jgi:hypothetical protein
VSAFPDIAGILILIKGSKIMHIGMMSHIAYWYFLRIFPLAKALIMITPIEISDIPII